MKIIKIISIVVFSLMVFPVISFAKSGQGSQKGIHEPGTGLENPELKEENRGTGQGFATQNEINSQNKGEVQQNQIKLQEETQNQPQAGEGVMNGKIQSNQNQQKAMDGTATGQQSQNQTNGTAVQRRSIAANAVQGMLQIAERNQGIGQQIREIAQAQNQNQEQIESGLAQIKNRGQLKKFFFGPDYKNLNLIEERLANHEEKLEQLKQLTTQITNEADSTKLQEQITVIEQVKEELRKEVDEEGGGFSLFGWLNKLFIK
jgi:hypothetical protein